MVQYQRLAIAPSQVADGQITLTPQQQHYLHRVLRLRSSDRFIAIDGAGQWWLSELSTDLAAAKILEPVEIQTELPLAVTLLLALPKTGMDDVVRQVTELGAARIVPILSDRTLLKPSPQKLERWRKIAQEAIEQSERQIMPEVAVPVTWATALQTWNQTNCFLCEGRGHYPHLLTALQTRLAVRPAAETHGSDAVAAAQAPGSSLTLAIGPEGGWTDAEIQAAMAAGYQPVSLGSRILRAVTAPVVAMAIVASVFEAMPQPPKSL